MRQMFYKSLLRWALAAAIIAMCHLTGSAQTFVYGSSEYTVTSATDKTVSLTKAVSGDSWVLNIPTTVEYNGEQYTVTEIGRDACLNSGGKWTLIPWTVKKIGRYALKGLSGTLIFQEPPADVPSSSIAIDVNVFQFGDYFQAYFGADQTAAPAPVFHRLYFGRTFNFYADEEDGILDEDLKAFFFLVSQRQLNEVIVGSRVTNFDRLLGYNSGYASGSYSAIRRLYLYNSDSMTDFPDYLLREYPEINFNPTNYTTVYVPAEMIETYASASGWKNYSLVEFTPKSSDCYDIDNDGVVNVADVSTIYLAMLLNENDGIKIDVNADGNINAGDISAFYKLLVDGDSRWWVNLINNKGIIFTDENDIMYQVIEDDEVAVIRFPQEAKSVVIPEQVESADVTYSVTRIAQYAANDIVESLVLPATIDSIEPYGLAYCLSLKSLSFMGSDNAKPLRVGPNQFHEVYKETYASGEILHCCYPYVDNDDAHDHLQLKYLYLDRDIQRNTTEITNTYARQLIFHQIDMDKIVIGEHVTDVRNAFGYGSDGCAAIKVKDIEVYAVNPPETWQIVGEFRTYDYTFFEGDYMYGKGEGHPQDTYYSNYTTATLHVPADIVENYKAVSPWNKFVNIEEITDDPEEITFTDDNGLTYQAIEDNKAKVIKFPESATVEIPEQVAHGNRTYTVKQIAKNASNDVVESLVIPATVDSIENNGLAYSLNLKNLTFLGADDAAPLRIGVNQFHELSEGNSWEFSNCGPNVSHEDAHDHLQLKNLYLDRNIVRNSNGAGILLSHQIGMEKIVIGQHVDNITYAFGYMFSDLSGGVSAIRVDTIELLATVPPIASESSETTKQFFEGEFRYNRKFDRTTYTFTYDTGYFSNYQSTKIIIPQGTAEAYSAVFPWNKFTVVEEKN